MLGLQDLLYDFEYADQTCLLTYKYSDMLDNVRKMVATVGLPLNISNTKVMRYTTKSQSIKIGEGTIETMIFC